MTTPTYEQQVEFIAKGTPRQFSLKSVASLSSVMLLALIRNEDANKIAEDVIQVRDVLNRLDEEERAKLQAATRISIWVYDSTRVHRDFVGPDVESVRQKIQAAFSKPLPLEVHQVLKAFSAFSAQHPDEPMQLKIPVFIPFAE